MLPVAAIVAGGSAAVFVAAESAVGVAAAVVFVVAVVVVVAAAVAVAYYSAYWVAGVHLLRVLGVGVLQFHWVSLRGQVLVLEILPNLEGQQANSATLQFFHNASLSTLLSVPIPVEVHLYPE